MLVEQCVKLNKQLLELAELQKKAGDTSVFYELQDLLNTGVNGLRPLHATTQLFKTNRDINLTNLPIEDADRLFKEFTRIQSDFETNPSSVAKDTVLRKILFSLPMFESNVRASLIQSWSDYTAKHSLHLDVDSLEILASIPTLKSIIGSIRILQGQIDTLRNNLPDTNADIQNFHNKINELKTKWQAMTGEGIPKSVITFLRACGGVGGANLDLLTDEVLNWLSGHHIEESFRVVIRRNI